ncbi:MAG: carboxy terminal-processing peptidase [Flavobacteriales bacterium]|nr:carboxy terminal-processing peptidase [Flavobacteriales bacterium]
MLKNSVILGCFASLSLFLFCFNSSSDGGGDDEATVIRKVRNTLTQMHYSSKRIDDKFSKDVFKRYIDILDPFKRYFKQSDFTEFKKYEFLLDDYFNEDNVDFYHLTVDRFYERVEESEKIVNEILELPLNFNEEEFLNTNEDTNEYAKTDEEYRNNWKKFLKYQVLREAETLQGLGDEIESESKDSASTKTFQAIPKPFDAVKDSAVAEVKEYMKDYFRRVKSRKKQDYFSIYVNSFTEEFDPHTTYFSPKEQDNFNSSISGKIIGVGARLQDKKGYPIFVELIIGGPAWKSNQIEVGDKILKVGQGKKEPVNVVGMLLEDAIQFIRGELNSEVVLVIQKKDGTIKSVSMTREEIELDESFARSAIIKKGNKKYGIIYLPEFYIDLENPKNGRNCSEDIKNEIIELKKEGIEGLIIDLRGNGGGSLPEVIEIAGQFITTGPIVQVRRTDGYEKVHNDKDSSVEWTGPLVVLVNEMSASASEIFAAAIQDYKRGVIIGPSQTYGKGTVQSVMPLDRFNFSDDKYGAIKLTIQKFYRINGSSTQLKGVVPDIILDSEYKYADIKESAQDNALPWDNVEKLSYLTWFQQVDYDYIKNNSKKRLENQSYLKKINDKAEWIKSVTDEKEIPLNHKEYFEDAKKKVNLAKKFEDELVYNTTLKVQTPADEEVLFKSDTVLKSKRERWYKNLRHDFTVDEAVNVLQDINHKYSYTSYSK